jgi:hypothetical protein
MTDSMLPRLKVSENRRFLITETGEPFFWLGDTAWELFHRLNLDEARRYFSDRQRKEFNVIQAVALAERDGLRVPDRNGLLPLLNGDIRSPNPAWLDAVDQVIAEAASHELYIALLPTWGDKVQQLDGEGPEVFDAETAFGFGQHISNRLGHHSNLIWINGGDRYPDGFEAVWNALASGIRSGAGRHVLMTYHPRGPGTSSTVFHHADWLDFNMIQSGHAAANVPNWQMVAADYALNPVRPTFDGEANYEEMSVGFTRSESLFFSDWDVRKAAYRSVFAGGFGHTYGQNSIWQMWRPEVAGLFDPVFPWDEAIHRPGAGQLMYLRRLIESRPFLSRIPLPNALVNAESDPVRHPVATGDTDGSWLLIYIPNPQQTVIVNADVFGPGPLLAYWYDPRNGRSQRITAVTRSAQMAFTTPVHGPDWVLVLERAAAGLPRPGSLTARQDETRTQ